MPAAAGPIIVTIDLEESTHKVERPVISESKVDLTYLPESPLKANQPTCGPRISMFKKFIAAAPSLPFQGDQAVDAHAARAPAPPTQGGGSGLSYHVFRGAMTGRYLAS